MTSLVFPLMVFCLLSAMLLALLRLFLGPSLQDRVLAANVFGTQSVLLLAALGFAGGRPDFLDIALLYALLTFIGTIAVLKFFRARAESESEKR